MSIVEIVDVGPRDGLQNAPVHLAPAVRAELVRRLLRAGIARVEAVSFVQEQRVPQMAGAEQVVAALASSERGRCCGLVLNERGYDRLLASGLRHARFALAASDAFHRANAGVPLTEGLRQALRVLERADADRIDAGIVLATSFGCPFSGDVDAKVVLELAERLGEGGAREIVFADTIGVAVPRQVRALIGPALMLGVPIGIHAHNTRNTGYACSMVAVAEGATVVEASLGGLGGCPFAPAASGNIATEDIVAMLEREGVGTGVDLEALLGAGRWLAELGFTLDSGVQRAA